MIFSILTFLLLQSPVAEAKTLRCRVEPFRHDDRLMNAPAGMLDEKDETDKHAGIYETVRSDCDNEYVVELEGYGIGLSVAAIENFVISCPWVKNFRGTYVGPKLHVAAAFGPDVAAFVGPGVCFIAGFQFPAVGVGVSIGTLRIMHKSDSVQPAQVEPQNQKEEIPEERKFTE